MGGDQEKQIARQRRERKLRLWLTTLSWSTPVIAFGTLFTIWHQIAETPLAIHSTSTKSSLLKPSVMPTSTSENGNKSPEKILYEIGSRGPQVSTIQQQLSLLGYYHYPITQYYGTVTEEAVKTFQAEHQLPPTGAIDQRTLTALQNAVKQVRIASLTRSVSNESVTSTRTSNTTSQSHSKTSHVHHSSVSVSTPQPSSAHVAHHHDKSGSAGLSQQSKPDATSSGS